jgi:hypothetical protein
MIIRIYYLKTACTHMFSVPSPYPNFNASTTHEKQVPSRIRRRTHTRAHTYIISLLWFVTVDVASWNNIKFFIPHWVLIFQWNRCIARTLYVVQSWYFQLYTFFLFLKMFTANKTVSFSFFSFFFHKIANTFRGGNGRDITYGEKIIRKNWPTRHYHTIIILQRLSRLPCT